MTSTTAYVKGGMPVDVEGYVATGGSNSYGSDEPAWCEVEDVVVYWHNSSRRCTPAFLSSLTAADWEAIDQAIIEAEG